MVYLVCWNHNCQQTHPAENYKPEDRDVKCSKCGGVLISPSGKVTLSMNPYVLQTVAPKPRESAWKRNMRLKGEIEDLADEICGDVHHGECFYELDMLEDFCNNLIKMKELALEYYDSNKLEMQEEDE
jgi:ribosomal protein S27E